MVSQRGGREGGRGREGEGGREGEHTIRSC